MAEVYCVSKLYANHSICGDEECSLQEVELKIWLEASDWYKFQAQPFYRELIQYLDNLETQKHNKPPDVQPDSQDYWIITME